MVTPLRKVRQQKRLTLAAVASATGTDAGNLSRLERNTQKAGTDVAARLSRFYRGAISEVEILYPERYQTRREKNRNVTGAG